jgi:hypothetical protein
MERLVYRFSDGFFRLLFKEEQGVEPLLIADRSPGSSPQRIFLVRYIIGEGGGGESKRPIFKDELTGYDYELKLVYPTQRVKLEALQSSLELSMYSSSQAKLSRAISENISTKEQRPIKAVVSESLVARLVALYGYAW